jgi:metal-sulfur cluster biosynthetic enzyme
MSVDVAAVRAAIDAVVDPCSRLQGTNLSLLDLGMVERVEVEGGRVRVELLLDDPLCMYTFTIQRDLRERVAALPGVSEVDISVVPEFTWSKERATPEARRRLLDDSLVQRLRRLPVQNVR